MIKTVVVVLSYFQFKPKRKPMWPKKSTCKIFCMLDIPGVVDDRIEYRTQVMVLRLISWVWVRILVVTLVSLSKTLSLKCFSPPRGKWILVGLWGQRWFRPSKKLDQLIFRVFPKRRGWGPFWVSIFQFFQRWPPNILIQTGHQIFTLKSPLTLCSYMFLKDYKVLLWEIHRNFAFLKTKI